jgi:hypothetical protein
MLTSSLGVAAAEGWREGHDACEDGQLSGGHCASESADDGHHGGG